MGLKGTVNLLLSCSAEAKELLQEQQAAGATAQLHRLVYLALRGRALRAGV